MFKNKKYLLINNKTSTKQIKMFYSIKEQAKKLLSMFNKLASGQGRLYSLTNNQTGTGMQTEIKVVCLLLHCTVNFKLKKEANPVINYINKATINFKNYAKTSYPTQNLSNSLTRPKADVDDNNMGKYDI